MQTGSVVGQARRLVLGQSNPAATTNTDVYTVPPGVQTTVGAISVCNQAGAGGTFRLAVRVTGVALAAKHYLHYDKAVGANDSIILTFPDPGLTLSVGDVITVYASSTSLSFSIFGEERGAGL